MSATSEALFPSLKVWLLGVRPKTLPVAVAPVVVGGALAWAETGTFEPVAFFAALIGALLIQAGTNLHNDAADFRKGTDVKGRPGPVRIAAEGLATPDQVDRMAYACFGATALIGLYLIWVGGLPILALGVLSILSGLAYTGGPKPIAYTPFGEIFVFLFFGLGAVMGTHYLQTLSFSPFSVIAGTAIGLLAAAVLAVNNYRDRDDDAKAGKNTFAVLAGRPSARAAYAAMLIVAYLCLIPLGLLLTPWAFLPAVLLKLAWELWRDFRTLEPGPAFNDLLARTARFQLAFSLLVGLGLLFP